MGSISIGKSKRKESFKKKTRGFVWGRRNVLNLLSNLWIIKVRRGGLRGERGSLRWG